VPTWEVVKGTIPAAQYIFEREWDLASMEPMVAKPHSPDNKDTAHNCRDVERSIAPYIGSCTGGKDHRHDLRGPNILKG